MLLSHCSRPGCEFQVVADHGFDVVDLHYAFRRHTSHRAVDGVHWNGIIHRAITNLLLWHVSDAWHVQLPTANSCNYSLLWNEPQQREQVARSANRNNSDSSFRHDDYDRCSDDYGRRYCTQHNRNPCQRNVDFAADDFSGLGNNFVGFGCYAHIPQRSTLVREFGNDLTNGRQPRQTLVARRGNGDLRNNRQRPY